MNIDLGDGYRVEIYSDEDSSTLDLEHWGFSAFLVRPPAHGAMLSWGSNRIGWANNDELEEEFAQAMDNNDLGGIEAALDKECSASLFAYDEEGGESIDAEIEAEIEGDSIVLRLFDYEDYFEFEKGSAVFFSALYYKGGESSIP